MKLYTIAIIAAIFLLSCLKESIPEAMLNKKYGPKVRATLSYKVNGNPVGVTVEDARNQSVPYYTLGCTKNAGNYMLSANTGANGTLLYFVTDSLAVGNYKNTPATIGQNWVLYYINTPEFLHASGDSMSINITSHVNGYVSGNFPACLHHS